MFKKIILSILFVLISFPSLAEENEVGTVTEFTIVTPVSCASSMEMSKVFKNKDIVFTGMISQTSIIKVIMNDVNGFAIMMENSAGLACIYFTGGLGVLRNKTKETGSGLNG